MTAPDLAAIEARAAALSRRFNDLAYALREDPAASGERWSVCRVCEAEGDDPHDPLCPVGHAEGRAALRAERASHAAEVAAAVAGERARCVAVCREEMALWAGSVDAGSDTAIAHYETAADLADAIGAGTMPADALTAPAATTGGA